ncbi:MAG: hypothetical protein CMJ89_14545 [Planctomycetes bacterium]|nr:hypothetical protein [Planctomycetota bacterium]
MLLSLLLCALGFPQTSTESAIETLQEVTDAWERFPVFVWRQRYRESPLPEDLVEPFGATNRFRNIQADWIDEWGLNFYVTNAVGRNDLHLDMGTDWNRRIEDWIETRDESLLVREPCLSDPATYERMRANLHETIASLGKTALGISVGDEVSLTPNGNPLDFCRSEYCLKLWREHARGLGLPPRPPTTDEVRAQLVDDRFELLGAWLENRRFHHARMVSVLKRLASEARSLTERPIGLLGLSGITPFGGVPVREAVDTFDFLEYYPLGLHREYASEGDGKFLTTVFLEKERRDAVAWVAWEHWMRGGDGLIVWNDTQLEDSPGHGRSLAQAVGEIRALEERLKPGAPLRPEVAIVADDDCVRVSWLRDALIDGPTWPRRLSSHHRKNGTREKKIEQWLRLLEDSGVLPRVVDLEGELPQVVILVEHGVLGRTAQHKLRDHQDKGGILIPDGELGWVNDLGEKRKDPTIKRWKKRFRTIFDPPDGLDRYTTQRWRPERVTRLREFGARLVKLGRRKHPTTLERMLDLTLTKEAAQIPWLTSIRPIPSRPDHYLVCMIPNHGDPDDRRTRMRTWSFALEPPPGIQLVEWIAPGDQPRGSLPMGQPLVFEIRDARAVKLRER